MTKRIAKKIWLQGCAGKYKGSSTQWFKAVELVDGYKKWEPSEKSIEKAYDKIVRHFKRYMNK